MTDQQLYKLLQQCTVRISVAGGQGTGFFVAPKLILTCAHVVEVAESRRINIFWKETNQNYTAELERLIADPNLDLALLRLTIEVLDHPCVYLDQFSPKLDDRLYSFGYPQNYPDGDSVTFEYEGESFKGNSQLHKLKEGQADYGLSGSPLLNQRTKGVCGIVNISRNPSSDLGARAVSTFDILSELPRLAQQNKEFHQRDIRWKKLRRQPRRKTIAAGFITLLLIFVGVVSLIITQGAVALNVSVSNKLPQYAVNSPYTKTLEDRERTLHYQASEVEQQIQITPQIEYLSKIENGEPISGEPMSDEENPLGTPPYFKWQFPNLDLRLVNNTKETIYITDIIVEVEKSVLDPSSVLVIPGDETNLLHFLLVNEGWGEIQNGSVRFNLVPLGQSISFNEPYQHEIHIGRFSETSEGYAYNVDVSDALRQEGIDIDALGYTNDLGNFETPSWVTECWEQIFGKEDRSEYCQNKINALGIFKNSRYPRRESRDLYAAIAYGEISFSETTLDGTLKQHEIKFKTDVPLLNSGGYGDSGLSTYQYETKLNVDRDNYKVVVQADGSSVSQFLKAGETDRFNILVGAEKSSFHVFRLRLIYNNGQSLLSRPINLKIFVPRSEAKEIVGLNALIVDESRGLAEAGYVKEATKLQRELIRNGKVKEAISIYEEAQKLNPTLEISASSWSNLCTTDNLWGYASVLMDACEKAVEIQPDNFFYWYNLGVARAATNDIEGAIKNFQVSIKLIDEIQSQNEAPIKTLEDIRLYFQNWLKKLHSGKNPATGEVLLWRGNKLAEKGEIKAAFTAFAEAQKLDPELEISANSWSNICWNGSLYGYAADVMSACEKAVALEPEDGYLRDSRGIARALTGNTQGAIEDFRAFIAWIDNLTYEQQGKFHTIKSRRQRWLNELIAGKNPFTLEEIQSLHNQEVVYF